MITLYHAPGSCSVAVRAVLNVIGLEHEIKVINLQAGDQLKESFLVINPLGKVPALDMDGKVLTEGGAILSYLNDKYPQAELMPAVDSPRRADAWRWLFTLYGVIHPAYERVFLPNRFSDELEKVKQSGEVAIHKIFSLIDKQLAKTSFIADDVPCLPDYYLMVAINWEGKLDKKLTTTYPNVEKYKQRMMAIPLVNKIYAEEYSG